jgi:hypothetical protein
MNVRLSVVVSAAVLSSLALVSGAHAQAPAGSAHQHGGGAGGAQHGGAPGTPGTPAGGGRTGAPPAANTPAANTNTMAAHGNAPAGNPPPGGNNNMNHPGGPGGQPMGQPGGRPDEGHGAPGGGIGFGVNVNVNAGAQRPVVRGAPVVYDARIQHENDAWLAQRDAARRNAAMWDAQRAQREEMHRRELEARWGQDFYYRPECRYEIALDANRTARLTRIIDIAEDNHDPMLASRARNLLARENARHAREMIALRIRLGYQ